MREHMMHDREHRASFAGLSQSDSQDSMNGTIQEFIINILAKLNLIGEQVVKVVLQRVISQGLEDGPSLGTKNDAFVHVMI
jgi:hypothetical protein